jgi:hypothetical protein
MKYIILILLVFFSMFWACNSTRNSTTFDDKPNLANDTIRIENKEIDYEVIIIDAGFTSWFNSYAKPKGYYSQSYLEARNKIWVLEWNRRVMLSFQYNQNLYEMTINYQNNTNYGYDVNYMIYNYLVYFQLTNNQELGGFVPRI